MTRGLSRLPLVLRFWSMLLFLLGSSSLPIWQVMWHFLLGGVRKAMCTWAAEGENVSHFTLQTVAFHLFTCSCRVHWIKQNGNSSWLTGCLCAILKTDTCSSIVYSPETHISYVILNDRFKISEISISALYNNVQGKIFSAYPALLSVFQPFVIKLINMMFCWHFSTVICIVGSACILRLNI